MVSEIAQKVLQGISLKDEIIIDAHCHMGPWGGFHMPATSAEEMLVGMDALGIQTACVTANPAIGSDFVRGNDLVLQAAKDFPKRYLCYATINPNHAEVMEQEITRCFAHAEFMGIKTHASLHGAAIDDARYAPAFAYANAHRLPVLMHVWEMADIKATAHLAKEYPNAMFIMGHFGFGAGFKGMKAAMDVINTYDNVVGDLAVSKVFEGNVEWLCQGVGSEKVLFGTDVPWFDPRPAVGRVALAKLTDAEKRNVLGLNMRRILDMKKGSASVT